MPITRKEMFAKCDEIGDENKVKNNIPHWNQHKAKFAQEWLDERKELALKRLSEQQEAREEKTLAIDREAIEVAKSANAEARDANLIASRASASNRRSEISAWIAAIAAIIAAIAAIISYISKTT